MKKRQTKYKLLQEVSFAYRKFQTFRSSHVLQMTQNFKNLLVSCSILILRFKLNN